MDHDEIEESLNKTIEELYNGLYSLAATTRADGSPDDLAKLLEKLAWDICKHWPICRTRHRPDSQSAV